MGLAARPIIRGDRGRGWHLLRMPILRQAQDDTVAAQDDTVAAHDDTVAAHDDIGGGSR